MANTANIQRREYKYLVNGATATALKAAVRPFCRLDPHANSAGDGSYGIDTLYFDNDQLSLFRANELEHTNRYKLRIRTYPSASRPRVFFEVKQRFNDVISKLRGQVPADDWKAIVTDPDRIRAAQLGATDRIMVKQFLQRMHTIRARPVCLVRYNRLAFASTIDDYARVTFDTRICSQMMSSCSFDADPRHFRSLDNPMLLQSRHSMTLIELKFTSPPRWMFNLVKRFELQRGSFSKYCRGVLAWRRRSAKAISDRVARC